MNDKLILTCIEVSIREDGYAVITLLSSSNDPDKYASGNIGFTTTLEDAARYAVDKRYDLKLQEVVL